MSWFKKSSSPVDPEFRVSLESRGRGEGVQLASTAVTMASSRIASALVADSTRYNSAKSCTIVNASPNSINDDLFLVGFCNFA